ncbi:MAG: glycoside hydrolase family 99-like domain-containing protein [Armatimonadetes bacterium]|nr:glycoside hydrolase family 99-like domain-containing protein [Armatimonadota bacterium]
MGGVGGRTAERIPWVLVMLVAAVATQCAAAGPASGGTTEARKPLLVAAYYVWYRDGNHPLRPWSVWNHRGSETNALALAEQRPGEPPMASAARPLIGPYDSADPNVVEWHVKLAQAAGLNAFLVDYWDAVNEQDKVIDEVVRPTIERLGFKYALLDERAQFHSSFDDYAAMLTRALRRHKDSPAYLRIDGRPVVYLYQVAQKPGLTPADFTALKARVEAECGPVYWIVDKIAHDAAAAAAGEDDRVKRITPGWPELPGVDCFAFYSTFSNYRAHTYDELAGKYRYIAQMAHDAGKRMLLPVHPGHDNSRFRDDPYVMPRRDGQTLRDFLRAATDAGADMVMVTSWNEWPETTVVEPSSTWVDPYLYLKILAEWRGREFVAPTLPARPGREPR